MRFGKKEVTPCPVGRSYNPHHRTCFSCPVPCATLDDIGRANGLTPKPTKYRAQKVTIDGITFDSKKEGARYQRLKMMEKAGQISNLTLQPSFELAPACTIAGKKKQPLRYRADFQYTENGANIIEDCKGMRTDVYIMKRHLMKSVLGLDIRET